MKFDLTLHQMRHSRQLLLLMGALEQEELLLGINLVTFYLKVCIQLKYQIKIFLIILKMV